LNDFPLVVSAVEVKRMQPEHEELDRRSFLRLSGAGAAVAGTKTIFPNLFAEAQLGSLTDRVASVNPVRLHSSEMEVTLDRNDGVPYAFHLSANDATLLGEDFGRKISATVCQKAPWKFLELETSIPDVKATRSAAAFHFEANNDNAKAVSFTVRYELDKATVTIKLEDVKELTNYELISVNLPRLVTVREEDPDAWLVRGDAGGSFAMLRNATAGSLAPNQFWGNVSGSLPVVMLGTATAMCVQETTAFMDGTSLTVTGENGKRRASIGTSKTYRVNGGDCYDLNLPKGTPRNCGVESRPLLLNANN
jgi:hypothetical protein